MRPPLPFFARFFLAVRCAFRVLFDAELAARVERALSPAPEPPPRELPGKSEVTLQKSDVGPALQLLALLQREGRLVDFLQQDVVTFTDADIGAAARVVHEGCRKALLAHARIVPIYQEEEGAALTLEAGFDAQRVKLTGNVGGAGPYRGVLRHRGWRAETLELPRSVAGHDAHVLAPAEVEL